MCLNYTWIIFTIFNLRLHVFHVQFCCFRISRSSARIIVLLKKSISYFINFMYKLIFLNFGENSLINKEMVSLIQLHTYNFGLVYYVNGSLWFSPLKWNNYLKQKLFLHTYRKPSTHFIEDKNIAIKQNTAV